MQPRPYGRFSGEAELSPEDAAAVELLARRVTGLKSAAGLDNFKKVVDLPSGRKAVAVDMGGTFRIIISEHYESPEFVFEGIAQANVPMLFCGSITKARVLEGEGVRLRITKGTERRLRQYKDGSGDVGSIGVIGGQGGVSAPELELQRFRIEYPQNRRYFLPRDTGIYTFTQWDKLRPTWYSGAMVAVVQTISGYGRQRLEDLPDTPTERARLIIPEKYMTKIRRELDGARLPGYSGFPDEEGHISYEYGASITDGVAFDKSNSPWLVRISSRGVFVMPLPMIPATTTSAFREFAEDKQDEEITYLLDRFGGMPSGEGFPDNEGDFEAWRRAGVIIKVCESADFHKYESCYAACGWSFNTRGTEAFNTCKEFDDNGLLHAHAYMLRLSLGAAKDRGWVRGQWQFASEDDQAKANEYLSGLYRMLSGNNARDLAIKYKVRNSTVEQILARAGNKNDRDYWDNLVSSPIAVHSGNVTRVHSGAVYWPKSYPSQFGGIKFPEFTGKGCESFRLASFNYKGEAIRSDVIIFGFYCGDSLQVVKYFFDERKSFIESQENYEDVMIVGRWEQTTTAGLTGLAGYVYTTAFDDRQAVPPISTHTEIIGTDMGYGQPEYRTPPIFFTVGSLSRSRYYMHRNRVSTTEGISVSAAICVPMYSRDCLLYAYQESTTGKTYKEWTTQGRIDDPTSYQLWCYDFYWHYLDKTINGNIGEPPSIDGAPVYVDTKIYNPTEISDFAESGNWFNLPDGSFIDVTSVCGPYTSRANTNRPAGGVVIGGEPPPFEPYSFDKSYPGLSTGRLSISHGFTGDVAVSSEKPSQFYWDFAPSNDLYFICDATWSAAGTNEYLSISEENHAGERKRWGNTRIADHKSAHHFIGVINE